MKDDAQHETPSSVTFSLRGQRRPETPDVSRRTGRERVPRITATLALAIRMEEMIEKGEAKDYADVARLAGLCRERVSQVVRLLFLAPDIQVEILALPVTMQRRYPISEVAVRRIANQLSWPAQREMWHDLKKVFSSIE